MDVPELASHFSPGPGYLDSATVGVPSASSITAMQADLERWRTGRLDPRAYDPVVDACRTSYATLVGTTPDRVGIVSQVSVATAVAASALGPGDQVVVAEEDFTSVLFPFLQARARGVEVVLAPLDHLLDVITARTTMVAVSAVQSADGRVADLDALAGVADSEGLLTYVDLTQGAGWLSVDADRFSMTACGGYKWLCIPRGTGFTTIRPDVVDRFTPVAAGWYAGAEVWSSIYGPPLRLATDGRRLDTSPAWNAWVGARPTLDLLAAAGASTIGRHDIGLANAFRARIGLEPSDSAIVSITRDGALESLKSTGVRCAGRAGRARLAFHLYNDVADVERAAAALGA